ncbi:hypothetical protein N0V90_005934 [Kalmusia sp. IMI 367209]|nr:hypothetical protein N0V90_005934 [Kalmusia sp. IMI 367209]
MPEHSGPPPVAANDSFVDTALLVVAILLPVLSSISAALRFYAGSWRNFSGTRGDDWAILVTLVLCWGHAINTIVAGYLGGINTIDMPPREYANLALRLAFCSTTPIESAWKNATEAKHRYDFNAWYTSYSALSIFFDIVILCLPIPLVKNLHVNRRRKLSIIGIFWLGGFVCVSSIIRFVYLFNSLYRLTDFGKNQYSSITNAFIWAEVEPNAAVIAACLPTYGPLFKEGGLFPKILNSLRSTTSGSSPSRNVHTPQPAPPAALGNHTSVGYVELDDVTKSTKSSHDVPIDSTMSPGSFDSKRYSEIDRVEKA